MSRGAEPAFPGMQTFEKFDDDLGRYVEETLPAGGLSKRELLAAMAMQGLLPIANKNESDWGQTVVEGAVMLADGLLQELKRKSPT